MHTSCTVKAQQTCTATFAEVKSLFLCPQCFWFSGLELKVSHLPRRKLPLTVNQILLDGLTNRTAYLRKPSIWSEGPYAAPRAAGWQSALERAGINDMRFHDLRHTFASHFLMNGGDLYTLKEILGHKDITTTSRYLTITTEHKSKAMEIFAVPENESNIIELMG